MKTFTIVGAYSGKVFAERTSRFDALSWGLSYGLTTDALARLDVGEQWKSHEDARGIKITRTS